MNNILLIYGGNSVEHEISIITALQIKNKYKGKYNRYFTNSMGLYFFRYSRTFVEQCK